MYVKSLSWTCALEIDYVMSLQSGISVDLPRVDIELDGVEGSFDVAMGLWADDTYSTAVTGEAEFTVPDMIHVGLILEGNAPSHYHMQLKQCWATPRYSFIQSNFSIIYIFSSARIPKTQFPIHSLITFVAIRMN